MSNIRNFVLSVDKELVGKTCNLGLNLTENFENYLKQLLTQFPVVNYLNNLENNRNIDKWWAGPDSNRRPSARQADVLTELDYRPIELVYFRFRYIATSSFIVTCIARAAQTVIKNRLLRFRQLRKLSDVVYLNQVA